MLGRLILVVLQLAGAWFGGNLIAREIPLSGDLRIFLYALLFAALVWVVGLVCAEILKDVARPSNKTLAAAIVLALAGAAITLVPNLPLPIRISDLTWPLIGAVLGYQLRR